MTTQKYFCHLGSCNKEVITDKKGHVRTTLKDDLEVILDLSLSYKNQSELTKLKFAARVNMYEILEIFRGSFLRTTQIQQLYDGRFTKTNVKVSRIIKNFLLHRYITYI